MCLNDAVILVAQLESLPGANRVSIFASGSWTNEDETSILLAHDTPVNLRKNGWVRLAIFQSPDGPGGVGPVIDLPKLLFIEHAGDLYLPTPDATDDPSYPECPHLTIAFSQEGA